MGRCELRAASVSRRAFASTAVTTVTRNVAIAAPNVARAARLGGCPRLWPTSAARPDQKTAGTSAMIAMPASL
jgi:hypothetical protein